MPVKDMNETFINPYNFIPLGTGKKIMSEREGTLLTGYISCSVAPKTDFFIPNTSNDDVFGCRDKNGKKHKSFVFFSYADLTTLSKSFEQNPLKPVIPGSELRGMIRSEYEALTDSCLMMDYDEELYARSQNYKSPGIVLWKSGNPMLYDAKRVKVPQDMAAKAKLKTGDLVEFSAKFNSGKRVYRATCVAKQEPKDDRGNWYDLSSMKQFAEQNGVAEVRDLWGVVLSGEFVQKGKTKEKNTYIFVLVKNRNPMDVSGISVEEVDKVKNALKRLEKVLKYYRDPQINQNIKDDEYPHTGYEDYKIEEKSPLPVWYEKDRVENIYFSPASRGKDVFNNTLTKILENNTKNIPDAVSYLPCEDKNCLCPACSLFGTIELKEMIKDESVLTAVASRLRFTDARFTGSRPIYKNKVTLQELAEPKLKCAEFYTHFDGRQNLAWNFDFSSSMDPISDKLQLNGRKFYLHHASDYRNRAGEDKFTERNSTIVPLAGVSDNTFEFKVFFDQITERELKQILVVLSCGDNDGERCHKIGLGKPLGLGSVQIRVDTIFFRDIKSYLVGDCGIVEGKKCYNPYFYGYFEKLEENTIEDVFETAPDVLKSYKALFSFSALDKFSVSYPIGKDEAANDNQTASYQWFINARDKSKKQIPQIALPLMAEVGDIKDLQQKGLKKVRQKKQKSKMTGGFQRKKRK